MNSTFSFWALEFFALDQTIFYERVYTDTILEHWFIQCIQFIQCAGFIKTIQELSRQSLDT